jgi:3-hydroxyacyl-CoA dehydrogenase/3a,7a,12a-trihydroxy-5b-cholest-24-enoyl-CoA hydratase
MSGELRFDDRVAIVTGAGNGLGRAHALMFAARGAKVVVNDLGGGMKGDGQSSAAADRVVAEIKEAGGEAVANYDSVEDGEAIVQTALDAFGRVDIVVNNAGILRDKSFHKLEDGDWDLVYRVHVWGAYKVTRAAWPHMRAQGYGRVIMTSSAAGIYGNFGQSNYSMAKLGLVGLSNTLAIEGGAKGVQCNAIAPVALSRMTESLLPPNTHEALAPDNVTPLVAWLCHEDCEENGSLFEVGGGYFGKLRWERTDGRTWRVGRKITGELIRDSWDDVIDFERAHHPVDVRAALEPVMDNVAAGRSRGGNALIDADQAIGFEMKPLYSSYDERDLALYALGVGAAKDPLDEGGLQLVFERHGAGFKPLPSYAVVPAVNALISLIETGDTAPGMNFGFERVLHGEQYTEVLRPLPPRASLTHKSRIKDIFDKTKGALVVNEVKTYDDDGELLAINEVTFFVRGAGDFGGDRGPSAKVNVPPDREPDATITERIPDNQALLYRLSGDWNPLHADPGFAKAFGFERPILHGLCTFGYATRHVVDAFSGGDPRYFKSIKVRFADSVIPGETLETRMWKESDTRIILECRVKERDAVVISNAAVELYVDIPKPKPRKAAAAEGGAAAPAVSADPTSADVFTAMDAYVQARPELVKDVGLVFQFKLSDPEGVWTIDLADSGRVQPGETAKPACTFVLSDADFMKMVAGDLDPQKAYFGGQLQIKGDVMASQKLTFLTEIDPDEVRAAASARSGGGGGGEAPAVAAEPTSADVFVAMDVYVQARPNLVSDVGTVFQFKLSDPESVWTIDLAKEGRVVAGETAKPACTFEVSDADFMKMVAGELDAQKAYFGGQLKIGGDVMASQKLTFLTEIDPAEVEKAMQARAAGGGSAAAPVVAAPAREAAAPGIFERLTARLAENPALAGDVQAKIVFVVTDPDAAWTVDLKAAPGSVTAGAADDADTTITVTDDDLAALTGPEGDARAMFQRGQLRVDGDMAAATRIGFMKHLNGNG